MTTTSTTADRTDQHNGNGNGRTAKTTKSKRRSAFTKSIRGDELLPWSALHHRLGWGARAIATAKKRGLRVLKFGRWSYVLGRDIIAFLESVQGDGGQEEKANSET